MSRKHLQNKSHHFKGRDDAWWYEENNGIHVVVERKEGTTIVHLPWRSIRSALKRKDRKQ